MTVRRFVKKPVVIEAVQYTGTDESTQEVCDFLGVGGMFRIHDDGGPVIQTLEGDMKASPGDFVIKGVKGEFYPCKPDVFEATYEPLPSAYTD